MRSTPKTSASVDQAKKKVIQSLEKKQEEQQVQTTRTLRSQAFNDEQLSQAWNSYKNSPHLADSPVVATIINTCEYRREGNTITLLLASSMQEQTFQLKLQPTLLKHLRNELQNDHIELKASMQLEQTGPKRVYTDEDRLQLLEEEYPHLKDLRDKLGLIIG